MPKPIQHPAFAIVAFAAFSLATNLPIAFVTPALAETAKVSRDETQHLGLGGPLDPDLLGKRFELTTTSWSAYENGVLMIAAGSAYVDNPAQGVLFLMQDGVVASAKIYDTPTATGPVDVEAIDGNVLVLRSRGGVFDAREPGSGLKIRTVKADGGTVYRFDLKTQKFR